jgi:hypothetical protein
MNNLADSQKKRDTLSIRWFSCCTLSSTFCGFPRSIQKNIDHPALSLPLGWRQSLCINVHRRGDVGVAHQLLHHFDVFPISFERRGIRVAISIHSRPRTSLMRSAVVAAMMPMTRIFWGNSSMSARNSAASKGSVTRTRLVLWRTAKMGFSPSLSHPYPAYA